MIVLASSLAFAASLLALPTPSEPKTGEIRVFVTDLEGKPADLAEATAIVYLEPAGGRRQTLKPVLRAGKNAPAPAAGVQWRETPKWRVGVQFAVGEAAPDATSFTADFRAESYACSMKDAPPQEKAGKCPGCGMEMELSPTELDATVVLRIAGETKSVRGFHYPPEVPVAAYAEGARLLEKTFADFERLIAAGKHDAAHPVADRLGRLAMETAATKDAPKDEQVAAAAKAIVALAEELDDAHHYGTPDEVKAVMARYREAVAAMRKGRGSD